MKKLDQGGSLMQRCAVLGCLVAALTLPLPQSAAAQAGGDLAIGYSFLSNDSLAVNSSSQPLGFYFDTAIELNDNVSIAFDMTGHYRRGSEASDSLVGIVAPLPSEDFQAFSFNRPEDEFCSPILSVCEVHTQTLGALAGPRFHFDAGGARIFVHALVGINRSLRKIGFFAHTATHLAIQPGGGVDIPISSNTSFRLQGDYRTTFFPEPDQTNPAASLVSAGGANYKDFSFSLGFAFKLGARRAGN
jgi:hypothetical protein